MGVWIAISAIATIVIAIFAGINWHLANKTKQASDAYHEDLKQYHDDSRHYNEELKSLFRAIVVASVIPSTTSYHDNVIYVLKLFPEIKKYFDSKELLQFGIKVDEQG
jgi:acyl-homoserine lactone acylase PvdQ